MKFTERPILIVGDVVLDAYVHGAASRLSSEAPVPILKVSEPQYRLGGAANVAANVKALGGTPLLASVVGIDPAIGTLFELLDKAAIIHRLYQSTERHTSVKTRIIANQQQIVRLDNETTDILSPRDYANFYRSIDELIFERNICGIIVSDYAKGILSPDILDYLRARATRHNVPVFLDPKVRESRVTAFERPTFVTPNLHEAAEIAGFPITNDSSLERAGNKISSHFHAENTLITRGEKGMTLNSHGRTYYFPTMARDVFDVSGAGDTVIAALALACVSGYEITAAVNIANHAAGVVVGKHGTSVCTFEELTVAIQRRGEQ